MVDKDNGCEFSYAYSVRGKIKMVQPRDVTVLFCNFKVGDTVYIAAKGVDHPEMPETKEYIRAELDFLVSEFKPGPEGKGTTFTRVFRINPKGSLPEFVKNLILKKSGMEMIEIRKAMLD